MRFICFNEGYRNTSYADENNQYIVRENIDQVISA